MSRSTASSVMLCFSAAILLLALCARPTSARTNANNLVNSDLTANSLNSLVQQQQLATKQMLEQALLKMSRMNEIPGAAGKASSADNSVTASAAAAHVPCTCGVFMSGQFDKAQPAAQPKGNAALMYEQDVMLPCTPQGNKQCTNRCLEMIVKYLPNSPNIVCGTIDRDCHRERAYLFIQNCNSSWMNTKLSAGREYCCKSGLSVPCPLTL